MTAKEKKQLVIAGAAGIIAGVSIAAFQKSKWWGYLVFGGFIGLAGVTGMMLYQDFSGNPSRVQGKEKKSEEKKENSQNENG